METRIAKKSRFQIVKLEERVAPAAVALGISSADAFGRHNAATATATSVNVISQYGFNFSDSSSAAAAAAN